MKNKKIPFEKFKEIYSHVTRLTVDVIVETSNGIVLSKRDIKPYKGMWHIPGGTVLYKERLEDAVRRVAKDELGVEVEIRKLLGYIEYPSMEKEWGFGWTVGLTFLTQIRSGKLRGSKQGRQIGVFKKIPKNTIAEERKFLLESLDDLIR